MQGTIPKFERVYSRVRNSEGFDDWMPGDLGDEAQRAVPEVLSVLVESWEDQGLFPDARGELNTMIEELEEERSEQ